MIFLSIIDVKTGFDEEAYTEIESLCPDIGVTPLFVGRIFEEADILLLLHSDKLEAVDDYLIKHVRKSEAAQELTLIPIYEFRLLPFFDSISELNQENIPDEESPEEHDPGEELLMIMVSIDVAPTKDKQVEDKIINIHGKENIHPLMTGRTFHSKEFDRVLFFLAYNLEAAWGFGKQIRSIDGVWDTTLQIIAHFESMIPLEKFREYTRTTV